MSRHEFRSWGPIVKIATTTLRQQVCVGGAVSWPTFEKVLIWVRGSDARVRVRYNGVELRTQFSSSYCDRGLLRSVEYAVEDAVKVAEALKIGADSRMLVYVEARIIDEPATGHDPGRCTEGYAASYRYPSAEWCIDEPQTAVTIDGQPCVHYPRLESVEVHPWAVVWDSKTATIAGIVAEWKAEAEAATVAKYWQPLPQFTEES